MTGDEHLRLVDDASADDMGYRQNETIPEVNPGSAIDADRISQQGVVETGRAPNSGNGEYQRKGESEPNPHVPICISRLKSRQRFMNEPILQLYDPL